MLKISVIVPIYNVETYLDECLYSLSNQMFSKDDYEVILVDDGSTDESWRIIDKYINKCDNFRLIRKANGGLSSARNIGLMNSVGEYVCFVDSDDFVSEDYLLTMFSAIKEYDSDIVISDFHKINHEGKKINDIKGKNRYTAGEISLKDAVSALYSVGENHYSTAVIVAWNKLIRKEIMVNHLFPEGLLHEDEHIIMPLLMDCKKIVWIENDLYSYRQRENSIMNDSTLALKHLTILDAFHNRIGLSKMLKDEKITLAFVRAYYWELEVWYYLMRTVYEVPRKSIENVFRKKMFMHILISWKAFNKRKMYEYLIFCISPEYYLKHFYK